MKNELRMRELTLRLISILVWFEILWAAVFLVGLVFQWSGLTEQLMYGFFGSGFCALLLLAALAILNFSANLSIISKAQMNKLEPSETTKPASFVKPLIFAGGLIGLIVISLWVAEWRLYLKKIDAAKSKVELVANTKTVGNIINLIANDSTKASLLSELTTLSCETTEDEVFSILIPKEKNGKTIYNEIGGWRFSSNSNTDSIKISEAHFIIFKPNPKEKKWLEKQKEGKSNYWAYSKGGNDLRAFLRAETEKGYIILLYDTSRRSSYKRGSFD